MVSADIDLGDENDILEIHGTYLGTADGQAGNDTLKLMGGSLSTNSSLANFETLEASGTSSTISVAVTVDSASLAADSTLVLEQVLTASSGTFSGTVDISHANADLAGGVRLASTSTLVLGGKNNLSLDNLTFENGATISLQVSNSATAIFTMEPNVVSEGKVNLQISGSLSENQEQLFVASVSLEDIRSRYTIVGAYEFIVSGNGVAIRAIPATIVTTREELLAANVLVPILVRGAVGEIDFANDVVVAGGVSTDAVIRANNITIEDGGTFRDLVLRDTQVASTISLNQNSHNLAVGNIVGSSDQNTLRVRNSSSNSLDLRGSISGIENLAFTGSGTIGLYGSISGVESLETDVANLQLHTGIGSKANPVAITINSGSKVTISPEVYLYASSLALNGSLVGMGHLSVSGAVSGSGVIEVTGRTVLESGVSGDITFGEVANEVMLNSSTYTGTLDAGAGEDNLHARSFGSWNFRNFENLTIAGGVYDVSSKGLAVGLETIQLAGGRLKVDRTVNLENLDVSSASQIEVNFAGGTTPQIVLDSNSNNFSTSDARNLTIVVGGIARTEDLPTSTDHDDVTDVILQGATGVADGTRIRVRFRHLGLNPRVFIGGEFNGGKLVLTYTYGSLENIDLSASLEDERRALVDLQAGDDIKERELDILYEIAVLGQENPGQAAKRIAQVTGESTTGISNQLTTLSTTTQQFISKRIAVVSTTSSRATSGPKDSLNSNEVNVAGFNVWVDFNYTTASRDSSGVNTGYDSTGFATRIGVDKKYENFIFGGAFSYNSTSVDTSDSDSSSDINSSTLTFYSSYLTQRYNVDMSASFSFGGVDYTRLAGETKGDTDSTVIDLDATWRRFYNPRKGVRGYEYSHQLIAGARLLVSSYSDIREDGTLALIISGQSTESLFAKVGWAWNCSWQGIKKRKYNVDFDVVLNHNFLDVGRDTTARFVSGSTTFNLQGIDEEAIHLNSGLHWSMQQKDLTLGFGLTLHFNSQGMATNWNFKAKKQF